MAYCLKILPRQRLDIILYSGPVSRADFDQVWLALQDSKEFEWDFDELAVFGPDADVAGLTFDSVNAEAQRFKDAHERVSKQRSRRTAIIVSSQVQALNARMFLAYIATNPPPNIEFKLFNKVHAGIAWVEEGRPDEPGQKIDRAEVTRVLAELETLRKAGDVRQAKAG